tara:strand:- start:894 stop:995 length:102 start_codon:yes stop_codon:yes gene_type:complete
MAPAQLGVREGFRQQWPAGFRQLDEVLAALADI